MYNRASLSPGSRVERKGRTFYFVEQRKKRNGTISYVFKTEDDVMAYFLEEPKQLHEKEYSTRLLLFIIAVWAMIRPLF